MSFAAKLEERSAQLVDAERRNVALAAEAARNYKALTGAVADLKEARDRNRELEAALHQIAAYYPLPALSAAEALTVARNALPQSETEPKHGSD